jgi:hypothetical protein
VQLGVMWIRDQDCEQLVLDVALSRGDGLQWPRVLLLGLILCVSYTWSVFIHAMVRNPGNAKWG